MANCVIHIGMHKTGSTSIQHSLVSLDDATHLYADICGVVNHSVAVYTAFARRPERHPKIRRHGFDEVSIRDQAKLIRRELRQAIARAGARTLVISGEGLTSLEVGEIERLKEFFDRHSTDVEIVAYVRGPAAFMSSSFQQRLKSGKMSAFDLDQMFHGYRSRLEKFDAVFGRGKVQLWKFDSSGFPAGSVVRDFCSRTGIDFNSVHEVRKNDSISRELSAILYAYAHWSRHNGGLPLSSKDAAVLAGLLGDLPATRLRLAPSLVRPILEANRDDLDWIAARLGQPLEERLGEDSGSDIAREADLLRPVPGAAHLLAAALSGKGIEAPEPVGDDINPLIEALIGSKREAAGWRKRDRVEADVGDEAGRRRQKSERQGGRGATGHNAGVADQDRARMERQPATDVRDPGLRRGKKPNWSMP